MAAYAAQMVSTADMAEAAAFTTAAWRIAGIMAGTAETISTAGTEQATPATDMAAKAAATDIPDTAIPITWESTTDAPVKNAKLK